MMGKIVKLARYLWQHPFRVFEVILIRLPFFRFIRQTPDYQCPITMNFWFKHKVLNIGGNKRAYWPVHWTSKVFNPERIIVGVDAYPGYMSGCYIQGLGGIEIGDYTQIAPNVAIISANHDLYDTRNHILKKVTIGKYCWIGAGASIMPGVTLGDWTIVGAGAVVTNSFPDGYCVVGGVPATKISDLQREKCIPFKNSVEYNGYIKASEFENYRKSKLNL